MKRVILSSLIVLVIINVSVCQNVFSISDAIVRYDKTKSLGTAQNPNPAKAGLQKWVSTPTNGISLGGDLWDAASYKAYFLNANGTRMAFRLKFPRSYNDSSSKKYPVMLFLHGAGEVGCPTNNGIYNNEKQLWLGGKYFRDMVNNNQFDGFLLYPQLVNANGCWGAWGSTAWVNLAVLISMIDSLAKYTRADIDRVVVDGLSGGGYGAWRMAESFPQGIAKIMPSAAAGSTSNRTAFVHIPIWFATGGKDPDPTPAQADYSLNRMKEIGADIRYTRYPDLGHAVWDRHWREPAFAGELNDQHKANPLVFFQHNEFCADESINAKLGITGGFSAYEWQRDGVLIASRSNGVNTIVQSSHVSSFAGNEITVRSFGTYRVRFRRTNSSPWSSFSPKPVVVKLKTSTQTPPIAISGNRSKVLPAPDGSTTVPLQLPPGFLNYQWYRVSDNALVASTQVFNAPPGVYKARYSEEFGCGTAFSENFTVVSSNGTPKPDAPTALAGVPASETSVSLTWNQGNNETGIELYRATSSGGPYTFVVLLPTNTLQYTDGALESGTTYYYIVRAVNNSGASASSNEGAARTVSDHAVPSAPSNLQYRGSTQHAVLLKWDAATDNNGIERYDIYANNIKIFSTKFTTFNVFNLDSLKSYTFTVRAIDRNGNTSAPSNQVTGYTHRQGVNYKYYTSPGFWTALPNFQTLTPAKTGVTDSVNINNTSIKTAIIKYGFLWEGYIYIPVSATYTFETISDDGTKIYIDEPYAHAAAAVVSNDGVHGAVSRTGTRTLSQGYHSIAITYFQGNYGYDMELFWSNNAGITRERIPKNFFSATAATLTPPPALPTGISATTLAYNRVRLNWTDNSGSETGYEVVRATSSGGTYLPVGTTGANTNTFFDSALAATATYYYKLRSLAASSESAFSGFVSATTLPIPLTPLAPSSLNGTAGSNSVSLNWSDNASNETAYRVYRSMDGTIFNSIATLSANTNAYIDLTASPGSTCYYYVAGVNNAGEGGTSATIQLKVGNNAPQIAGLSAFTVKTGQIDLKNFYVADETGDVLSVQIVNKPAFVTLSSAGGNNYSLTVSPTLDDVGWHNLVITATDNHGRSDTSEVDITVADQKTRSVFINFGHAGKVAPLPWNNWNGYRSAGNSISSLKDENNGNTPFSVTTLNNWVSTTVMGHQTGNNSGVVPDAVLESGIGDNGAAKQIRIAGLNPALRYNLAFISSQNEGLLASAQFQSGAQTSILDARYNTSRTANLNGLIPDASGQITVTITRTGATTFMFLNALIIEEYSAATGLLNPGRLIAEPRDRTSVNLTWTDRSSGESAGNGYELQRASDSLFTQNVTTQTLTANSTSYLNTGLQPNTRHWYRVRARNGGTYSAYSNKYTVITPAAETFVNFNTTVPDAPAPWNNLVSSPMSVFSKTNLKNHAGANSGIGITLTKEFNGEFTAGVSTGNNSGVAPDNVMLSNYWIDPGQVSRFVLSGLNHTRRYRIGFLGSSSSNGWFRGDYTAKYTVNGKTVYLNS